MRERMCREEKEREGLPKKAFEVFTSEATFCGPGESRIALNPWLCYKAPHEVIMALRSFILAFILSFATSAFAGGVSGIVEASKEHLYAIQGSSYSNQTCGEILGSLQADLRGLNWDDYSNSDLHNRAAEISELFWQLRLAIHSKLDVVGSDCTLQVRDVFFRLRDAEDYLSEFSSGVVAVYPENLDFQKGLAPLYQMAPYETSLIRADLPSPIQLHRGDVLLARGTSFVSAIISRMTSNRSGFSHSLIWNVEPVSGAENSVESYMDMGVMQFAADFALKNENVRLTVLRPKDASLGSRAAGYAMQAAKAHLPYDYAMDFQDDKALSCVEVITSSYAKASNGAVQLPLYPGKISVKSSEFLSKLSLRTGDIISPADLETDPRFELVADWRDNRLIRDSRHKDAILSEMLRWVDVYHYRFKNTSQSVIAKYILQPARNTALWPLLHKLTGASINSEMPRPMLGVAVVMKQVGEKLLQEVRKLDQQHIAEYGRPMTGEQLRAALEKYRFEDLRRYYDNKSSAIHGMFRPASPVVR